MRRPLVLLALALLALPAAASARTWPTWGNTVIADCAFAAAANWELAALGHLASERQVEQEFFAAGGSPATGITEARFLHWWGVHGIGGIHATVRKVHGQDIWSATHGSRPRLERLLARAHYLLATILDGLESNHEVLVTAASAAGVTYVSYGAEVTESWPEWYEGVLATYIVTVRRPR